MGRLWAFFTSLTRAPSLNLAALLIVIALASPAHAVPQGNTLKLNFGSFDVFGTWTKKSCAAQSFLQSNQGHRMGFSIYWVPRKALYVMTKHPGYANARGKQTVRFVFPSGQALEFKMKRKGSRVQASIGFGSKAKAFYKLIEANKTLRIELPGVGDTVDVSLKRRREIESAMRHCRDWLKS